MILDSVYPSRGGGGAEAQVGTLSRWLTEHGIPCTIVVPMVAWGPQVAHETEGRVEIVRLRYPRLPLLGGLILQARLMWFLLRRRHRIQALHAHIANNMAASTSLINRLLKKPLLVKLTGFTELNGGILDKTPRRAVRLKRSLLKGARIQAISHMLITRLLDAGFERDRIHHIPNAVDTTRFNPDPEYRRRQRERTHPGIDMVAVYVGRLEAEKGVDLLIDTWMSTFSSEQPVKLILVGSGSLQDTLEARVQRQQRQHQIEFAGQSTDVAAYLAAADIGLLTSHAEGLSNTLLESMAAGLPMIGSRVSGNEDFIEPEVNGWLFPAGNAQALAECLRTAHGTGHRKLVEMGQIARIKVESLASIPAVSERLLALYADSSRTLHNNDSFTSAHGH